MTLFMRAISISLVLLALNLAPDAMAQSPVAARIEATMVKHRQIKLDGLTLAYREAGDPGRPTIVLLHSFPSSSYQFRDLIPLLAHRYHVLAPDYPGFGASDTPPAEYFDYSFATVAALLDRFLQQKGRESYVLYMTGYGGPVGFHLYARAPERVAGLVIQNANLYQEGLREFWRPIKTYWSIPTQQNGHALTLFFGEECTYWMYTHGVPDEAMEKISPTSYAHDQHLLERPGVAEAQLEYLLNYRDSVALYPRWQAMLRDRQPPALILWGEDDHIHPGYGAEPYRKNLRNLEFHLLEGGHFVLETHLDFVSERILAFMDRTSRRQSAHR